jgi:hypothetical protein
VIRHGHLGPDFRVLLGIGHLQWCCLQRCDHKNRLTRRTRKKVCARDPTPGKRPRLPRRR